MAHEHGYEFSIVQNNIFSETRGLVNPKGEAVSISTWNKTGMLSTRGKHGRANAKSRAGCNRCASDKR